MKFSQLLNRKDSIKEKAQTAFVRASNLFDERWYASRYQDVFKKLKDPARHYYLVGWKENRNPSENFDTASYLRQYPECGICPIVFEHNRNDYADLAVCIIVKDEAPYIKEWLDYHLMVGVKRFYIYDNESFDNLKQVLLPYIRQGVVIYQYYPGEVMQLNCYRDCLKQYGDKNEWIAFIDADEFIIPMENATIPEFLADYKEYPAVGVNWVSYDSNGHKEKPKGGVMENYTRVHYDENMVPFHLIKSIVRPQEVSKVVNPHFFLYKGDKLAVNENKEEIGGDLSERAYISPFSTNKIRINHYYCKSRAEAEAKVLRGSSDRDIRRRKSISAKELNFPDYKYDYTAYKFVLQLNPEKAKIEEIKMAWLRLKNAFIEFKHTFNPSPLYDYIDEEWYFKQYPDAKKSGMSAAKHYVNIGWRKGYNPSKKFNTEFYLNKYKDVAKAHICPLLHYLNSGKNEGRLAYETDTVISTTEPVSQPLLKHLSEWVKNLSKEKEREYNELWQNKAYFDENWYLKQYPDAKESGMSAKKHYDTIGWLQGYNPSAKFKTNEYLKQYPECKICPIDFEYNRNRYVDLAVCAIMKNEAPYVKEWLDYHQMVGVKRFYIYDNESSDDLCQVLLPYIRQGIVVYKNYPGEAKQMPAYNEFIKEYGDKNEWVAFIDADEFIIPMEKESIPEFLADYKEYPGVGINWVAYDSNGHKAKPEGGVLENYTRVHYDENLVPFHQIKSIVQPSQVDKIINPHYALFKDNKLAVNENKQEIGGSLEERAYISPFSANKIRINHYFCKSEEEYKAKIERGRAPTKRGVKRVYNQNQVFFDDYKYDYSAYRFVTKLKPEIAQDEEVKYAFKHSFNQNPLYDYIDEKWYFELYPDAKESGMSAAEHYMNIGWRKGYNPSKKFDTNFYLKKYKDVARMHVCPLLHYLNSGKKENRLAFEGDTVSHTEQSDIVIPTAKPVSQKIEGHTGFSPVSQPTQNNTVITAQNNTVIPTAEPVSLPLLKSLCEWCKTLFKGKEEPRLTVNTKYVANPFRYITDHIFLSDKELKAPKYENAVLLPIRSRNDGSIWYMGGVLDADGNYIEETSLKGEIKYNDYKIENDLPYIDEDVVYIGLYWNHYGHFIIEQVARLWYYIQNRDKNLKLCYSMANNEPLPQYIEQFFKLLGITDKNSLRVSEPTKFKSITIPEMSVSASGWYTKEYQLIYDTIRENIVPVYNDKIYLSRTHLKKCKEYEFGEWYIEKLFASNGYKIIHPEELSFIGQLSIIKGAKTIACISGSLLHQMLFAKEGTKLIILQQFEEINSAQRPVNEMRKLKVTYIDCYVGLPYVTQGVGPYLLVNNNALQNFAKDNNFISVEYNKEKAREDFYKYIDKWQEYADNKRLKTVISEDEKEKSVAEFKQKHIHNGIVDCDIKSIVEKYFDEKWYEENYPEYKQSKLTAFEHYIFYGWKLGYNPSKQFDGNAYLAKYTDVAKCNMNPLVHYVLHGEREGRQIFSVKQREEVKKSQNNVLYWIKSIFTKKKMNENPLWNDKEYFDEDWYVANYVEAGNYKKGPKAHYRAEGWKKGYNPSANFKTNEYLKQYPECKICPIDFEYNRNGYTDLAVCAIMKNEAPYVKEWIDYHRLVGVKRFYIYDNESTDNMREVLRPYIEHGILVYKYQEGYAQQNPVYNECMHNYGDKIKWLGFIDTDEFVVPVEKNNIPDLLQDYDEYAGVAVNWLMFDSNGHIEKPKGGLLENYQRINWDNNLGALFVKLFVQPLCVENIPSPHRFVYKPGYFAVLENKMMLDTGKTNLYYGKKIHINHYYCKSEEEATIKANRGTCADPKGVLKPISKTEINFRDYKYNYDAYRYFIKLCPQYMLRETFKYVLFLLKNAVIYIKHLFDKSKLVDYINEKWYFMQYPDAKNSGLSACEHYMNIGWRLGYNPSEKFDADFYLKKYPDVAKNNVNPLRHYLIHGKYEGRLPKASKEGTKKIFSSIFSRKVENIIPYATNKNDAKYQLLDKSELFDKKWYTKKYLKGKNIDPIDHYLSIGWKEGCNPCLGFDGNAYLERYKDVKNVGMNPLVHYLNFGQKEGRQCFTSYSWWDRILNPYIGKSDVYIAIAKSGLFDKKYYLNNYRNAIPLGTDPLDHYLTMGWKEGKNPSKEFKGSEYLKINPDIASANVNPLHHYVETGKKEGRIYKIRLPEDCSVITKCVFKLIRLLRSTNKVNRVLLVSHELTYTGAPLSLLKTAQCLSEMGYSLKILSLKDGDLRKEFEKYGEVVISDNIDKIVLAAANCDFVIINTMVNYCEYSVLNKLLPTVWWIREPHNMLDMYRYRYIKQILRFASNVYTMSDFSRQEFLAYNPNISVIKHGYDDEYRHKPINTNELSFAVIGSIDERKGQDIFAEAIRLLPEEKRHKAKFYIVGKKHNVKYYESLKNGLDGILEIMEPITEHKDMLSFYEKISCVVIPSREEPTSRVAIEAMMMARPAIMSDQVGAQYLYNGRNGAIFKNENAEQLSKLIEDIIDNPQKLEEMSVEARKAYIENNSIEVYKKNLQKMIDNTSMPAIKAKKLLVHLHLYYHEQLDYFISKLKNITCDYDLYVTYVEKNETSETKLKKFKPEVKLIQVENKGYDLYPFVEVLNRVNLDDYSYILKMHTKNYRTNYWSYNGVNYIHYQWRDALVNALIGSKRVFRSNLKLLSKEYIGMIGNKDLISHKGAKDNEEYRLQMCEKLGYNPQYDEYIAGTMFLCKSFLMKDIKNLHLTINDFDFSSSSGVVGTLAHAMESIVGHTVQNNGLDIYGRFVFSFHRLVSYIQNQYKIYQKSKVLPPYEAIKKSKYFDAKWYLKRYPDVAKAGVDPAQHYLDTGWKENYLPSERFDGNWYLKRYKDIANANICPLLHYENDGKYEGRKIHSNNICENAKIINEIKKSRKLGVTRFKRNPRLIVSLTTFPARIEEVVFSIYSLLEQSIKADEIVLWLGVDKFANKEKDLPDMLLKLVSRGLTIKWCKDIRSYTKLVPTLKEYPNDIIVTADDDIYYPKDWLEKLYNSYKQYPNDIQCHRVHKICLTQKYDFMPYNEWKQEWRISDASYLNFLTGVGGVLYPPHSLCKDVLKQGRFQKYAPLADDVWFWAMAVLNNTKIRNIQDGHPKLTYVNEDRENGVISGETLANENVINGRNDEQIRNVMNVYPQIIKNIKQEIQKHTKNERKVA